MVRSHVLSLHDIAKRYDVRAISPRAMTALSEELYFAGLLDREQYQALAFQAELMPNYDLTIGALTGQRAEPDKPRDYTQVWRAKLAFEMKHLAGDPRIAQRTRRILELLQELESPRKLPALVEAPAKTSRARRDSRARRVQAPAYQVPPVRLTAPPSERW